MDKFIVAPAFLATSEALCSLKLCEARLDMDSRFPWLILIPRRVGALELEHLRNGDRAQMMEEIVAAGSAARAIGAALGRPVEKLNVGALGNITTQLHVHVIGRRHDDAAWPGPAWGNGKPQPYDDRTFQTVMATALNALKAMQAAA